MGSMSKWVWCNKNLVICLSSIFELARICGSQQLLSIVSWCLFAKRVVALVFSTRPQHSPKNVVIALCCIVAVLCPGVVCSVEQKFYEGPQGLQQLVHTFSQNAGVGCTNGMDGVSVAGGKCSGFLELANIAAEWAKVREPQLKKQKFVVEEEVGRQNCQLKCMK